MSSSVLSAAKVQLTLMCLYRVQASGSERKLVPFVGTEAVWLKDGAVHITAASVPFHHRGMDARAPQPGHGILALFGIRDALDELQHWRTVARNAQAQFAYLQLQVDVGVVPAGALTRVALQAAGPQLKFANVKRCAMDLQKEWLAQFANWVQAEGGDAQKDMAHVRQMALRPDLFERLLLEDPDLQHVDVLVFPLADRIEDPGRTRQVALLRAGASLLAQTQGNDQVHVHLPQWMAVRQLA